MTLSRELQLWRGLCNCINRQNSVIRAAATTETCFLFDLLLCPHKIPLNFWIRLGGGGTVKYSCAILMVIFWHWCKWLVNSAFTQVPSVLCLIVSYYNIKVLSLLGYCFMKKYILIANLFISTNNAKMTSVKQMEIKLHGL